AAKPSPKQRVAVADKKNPPDPKKSEPQVINLTGKRDPFISPVVNRSMVGSGCSSGKRCLAIDQIALKGVVKSDTGMIAVVVNALDKAYFLHENDPVFNGYVVKITGDSIVFKETVQDKLGKSFTREVTKKITTPAVERDGNIAAGRVGLVKSEFESGEKGNAKATAGGLLSAASPGSNGVG